jgi:hypothetical protein
VALPEFPQRPSNGFKKKKNPIVVVEAVETGEIRLHPCPRLLFFEEGLGIAVARLSKLGRFPLFPEAGENGWAAIGPY